MVRMSAPLPPRSIARVVLVIVGLVALAWLNRFMQDDAFISFRYARNLAEGHGLVWNPGETPVAGYSTFLWTMLIAGLIRLGADPVVGSWVLGLALCAGTLVLTWRLAGDLRGDQAAEVDALWVVVLLGTNYTFSAWATGGMETQLQAFLVTAATLLTFRATGAPEPLRIATLVLTSLSYGLLLMTRLDSAVVVVVLAMLGLLSLARKTTGQPLRLVGGALALALPGVLAVGGWLVWAYGYYGDVLPNTYYVKVATSTSTFGGIHYIYRFLAEYWFVPLGLLLMAVRPGGCIRAFLRPADRRVMALLVVLLAWSFYVVRTGGDFMEFRFVVAVLPLLLVWLWRGVTIVVPERHVRFAVVLVLVAGSFIHAVTFRGSLFGIESIDAIAVHMREEGGAWDEVGKSLGRYFGGPGSDVSLAVAAAGAIPYFSGLRSVDMRGLNDRWVARHGHVVGNTPGHQRMASFGYLADRRVTLVVGHPQVRARHDPLPSFLTIDALHKFGLIDATEALIPEGGCFLAVPVGESLRVTVLYLTRNAGVDAAIAAGGLEVIPLRRR